MVIGGGALKRMTDTFKNRPHDAIPSALTFPHLDVEKVASKLNLEERGAIEGRDGRPPKDSSALDVVEADVVAKIEQERGRAYDELQSQIATYDERLTRLSIRDFPLMVRAAVTEALQEFTARTLNWKNELGIERDEVLRATTTKRLFQEKHLLHRPATYPPSFVTHYAIVAVFAVVEAMMNGYFFAKTNDFGLSGGFFQAILIALLNISGAVLIARFGIRQLNHRGRVRKVLGWGALLLLLILIPGFNLAVAHFRDGLLLATTPDPLVSATAHAIEQISRLSVALHDFESYILWGLGAVFAVVASFKAYSDDDPYPGYGAVYRQWHNLHDAYADKSKEAIEDLRAISQDFNDQFKQIRDELARNCREHDSILSHRARTINQYKSYLEHLQTAANQLLTLYRRANRAARADNPSPHHFDKTWAFSSFHEECASPPSIEPGDMKLAQEAVNTELEDAMSRLKSSFDEAADTIPSIDDILKSESKNGEA